MNPAMLSLSRPSIAIPPPFSISSSHQHRVQSLTLPPIRSSSSSSKDNGNGETINNDGTIPPPITPPGTVEIRFRRGSRRRRREQEDDLVDGQPKKAKTPAPKKNWESMTLSEKAVELYTGEKGLLFWLNKFAYASIFIVIGGWIVFRFVGPALNLYQLDAPPLSPTSVFKGS